MAAPNRDYNREMEAILSRLDAGDKPPALLLHACCAPCSSAVLERLSPYFSISVLYYDPNIAPEEEYRKRKSELVRLLSEMPLENPAALLPCEYGGEAFGEIAGGLEDAPEGGERCMRCFRLRLRRAAEEARRGGFDWFTTTLTLSPLKNAAALNAIGEEMGEALGVRWLPSDFKKRDGYKRSLELSREYSLYRQDYCGCVFSKAQREREKAERKDMLASHT